VYIPSNVLTFSKIGKYVLTFETVWVDVSGAAVLTKPMMFSILLGSERKPDVSPLVTPDNLS